MGAGEDDYWNGGGGLTADIGLDENLCFSCAHKIEVPYCPLQK